MSKNKIAIAIALFLMLTMTVSLFALPLTNAHDPPWTIPTWAYLSVEPNPIGVGQEVFVNFWLDKVPPTAAMMYGDRWHDFKVTVTDPSGNKETLGPFTSDDAGGAHTTYTPDTVGNYTFVFNFPGQTIVGENPPPVGQQLNAQQIGDIYEASTSRTVTLVVQDEPIKGLPDTPLPTGYWSRPIFAENTNWYTISGNWYGGGRGGGYNATGNFNPYTTAPNTGHILWTKPYAVGGLIGGEFGGSQMNSNYYSTAQYETKFAPIIINGILYYTLIPGSSTSPGGWLAVDLRTGQEIWTKDTSVTINRGQIYDYVSPNQFGGIPYLWSNEPTVTPNRGSTYGMYDAMTGKWILNIVNGTGATFVADNGGFGSQGSMLGYYINMSDWTLNLWNSSRAILIGQGAQYFGPPTPENWVWRPPQGASIPWDYGIEWSVPMTTTMTADNGTVVDINAAYAESAGVTSNLAISRIADVILVTNTPGPIIRFQQPGYIIAEAYSLEDGHLLWGPLNLTQTPWCGLRGPASMGDGVFTIFTYETQSYVGYSTTSGQKLWGPTSVANDEVPWGYYVTSALSAYGNLYSADFGGYVNCIDLKTGDIKWTFWTGESGYETPYGVWPVVNFQCIADGKIYVNGGHLYSPPLYQGGLVYCINATSGELIWSMPDFAITNGAACAVADGIFVLPNAYDNQLYAYGKGPSATTVTASPKIAVHGSNVLVEGMVTDESAGTKNTDRVARFPNGVPAISDESMGSWMEYVYMQQPKPTNATGVKVTISVLDPNNNEYDVDTTTSDAAGFFSTVFTPEVPGKYTVIATFAGSESYYGSSAETAINVEEAPAATAAPAAPPASMSDLYLVPGIVGIIIAIAVVGAILVLMLKRR